MIPPESRRTCQILIAGSLILLTVGVGYDFIYGTKLADFLVIIAGLLLGWIAFFYCLGHLSAWRN